MAFPNDEKIRELIAPALTPRALDIEGIKISRAGKKSVVAIKVDSDSRPTLDELEEVSNDISELLDASEETGDVNFGAGYTLELSTPGVDMPLRLPRHWRRNRDRLVVLNGADTWRIGALNPTEEEVVLVRHGNRKITPEDVVLQPLSEVNSAVVEIEFSKPVAAELELTSMSFEQAQQWREDNK